MALAHFRMLVHELLNEDPYIVPKEAHLIGYLVYLFSTRVDFSFALHKLAKLSANPGNVHFEGLVHLLRYIRDNKTLGLK